MSISKNFHVVTPVTGCFICSVPSKIKNIKLLIEPHCPFNHMLGGEKQEEWK